MKPYIIQASFNLVDGWWEYHDDALNVGFPESSKERLKQNVLTAILCTAQSHAESLEPDDEELADGVWQSFYAFRDVFVNHDAVAIKFGNEEPEALPVPMEVFLWARTHVTYEAEASAVCALEIPKRERDERDAQVELEWQLCQEIADRRPTLYNKLWLALKLLPGLVSASQAFATHLLDGLLAQGYILGKRDYMEKGFYCIPADYADFTRAVGKDDAPPSYDTPTEAILRARLRVLDFVDSKGANG